MPAARLSNIKKVDPAEYMNATYPNNGSSTSQIFYKGKQRPDQTYADRWHLFLFSILLCHKTHLFVCSISYCHKTQFLKLVFV